jgi:multidrug efflux pump subunit AcrB
VFGFIKGDSAGGAGDLFFLRSLRATLVPLVTIPVALVGAFGLMYAFGFTINT